MRIDPQTKRDIVRTTIAHNVWGNDQTPEWTFWRLELFWQEMEARPDKGIKNRPINKLLTNIALQLKLKKIGKLWHGPKVFPGNPGLDAKKAR